jgi:hypothetical protein
MAKAIKTTRSGRTIGLSQLGRHGIGRGSIVQQVHDGDTIIVEAAGNISIRMLGIDTPEVSFTLPNSDQFRSIGSNEWVQFLSDPFNQAPAQFITELGAGLQTYLQGNVGPNCSSNHAHHAEIAHRGLEQMVQADMTALGQDRTNFHFFMSFAHEIMDGYGRFLCFINRDQESPNFPHPRPASYNERLLEIGLACPYFIWPNINPFRRQQNIVAAVPPPSQIQTIANGTNELGPARQWIRQARTSHAGIFDNANPLTLQPFELRFLARRTIPSRWVIDLSDPNPVHLLKPINYYTIPNTEDRLFIPPAYVTLFLEAGWQRQP